MPRKRKLPQAKERFWIGYCRKSTDTEDKQIHTLNDQAKMIEDYYQQLPTAEREHRPLRLLQEAQSAYHPGRPVFNNILQMAARGAVYGVIVVHPNRISRNHSDSGAFVQRLVDKQIGCLATTSGKHYTGIDSNDIFMLTLEGAMSWKDSRDKGERILQAMRMRAAEGKNMGPVPIGYRSVFRPDGTRVVELDPEKAPLVRRLFELAATGSYSTQNLVSEAWGMGLRGQNGRKILRSSIHAMLHKPFYKGTIQFDGIVAKGTHDPIITAETWERVQLGLEDRRTDVGRPKDLTLRDLFVFGKLLQCPKCGRNLCPYRAKKLYAYYECKNPETSCGVCVSQSDLIEQLPPLLEGVFLDTAELEQLRKRLLLRYRNRDGSEIVQRRTLNKEYENVLREIGDVFAQRKEAVILGIEDVVDRRLGELKRKRDDLQEQLNATHERGTVLIDKVIRTFELVKLLQEAIIFGSRQPREMSLKAIASNFSVDQKKLKLTLKSPFRESAQRGGCPEWWCGLDEVRTEILQTCEELESVFSWLKQGVFS